MSTQQASVPTSPVLSVAKKNLLSVLGGWVCTSSPETDNTANTLRQWIYHKATELCGAPQLNSLHELDAWLLSSLEHASTNTRVLRNAFKDDSAVSALFNSDAILALAEQLTGDSLRLHEVIRLRTVINGADYTVSRPHQDTALWPNVENSINVWVALCDVSSQRAPLIIVPESNKETLKHVKNEYEQLEIPKTESIDVGRQMVMHSGEILYFDPALIHYSARNSSNEIRWSVDFRYVVAGQH